MAKTLIVGNWKMHLNTHQASLFLHKLEQQITPHRDVEVVVAPSMLSLQSLSIQADRRKVRLAAQNCYWRDEGAYTGEVSATMLRGVVDYVIVGHSERRHIFGELDTDIRGKVQAVLRNGMQPILCIGETATERADQETRPVLRDQVVSGLSNVTSEELDRVVIAYEPVWAISNGTDFTHHQVPTTDNMAEVAGLIRHELTDLYGKQAAARVRILYGGSATADNAISFLTAQGVDGLLVGGASLQATAFVDIIQKAHQLNKS